MSILLEKMREFRRRCCLARPVLADQANLAARYQRRLPLYRMAHISIPADAVHLFDAESGTRL